MICNGLSMKTRAILCRHNKNKNSLLKLDWGAIILCSFYIWMWFWRTYKVEIVKSQRSWTQTRFKRKERPINNMATLFSSKNQHWCWVLYKFYLFTTQPGHSQQIWNRNTTSRVSELTLYNCIIGPGDNLLRVREGLIAPPP